MSDFLAILHGVKEAQGGQFMALCPAHNDRKPSLSIKQLDGKILVRCFAGCELTDILKPVGLNSRDLFFNSRKADTKLEYRVIEAVYHYDGFEVVRTRPKAFYQRRPDGKGGYINNLKGVKLSLYHQDELPQAIAAGTVIFIPEGEKDVDRLRSEGFTATCNPMGAGKWHDGYSQALKGADAAIMPDSDRPGRDHAAEVARSCFGKAARIRLLELADGKDVSEWLDNGHTVAELTRLANRCPDYELPAASDLPEIAVTDRHLRDITTDVLDALYKANKPERIFRRNSALTRISLDEKSRPFIETLSESALRGYLARSCNFVRISAKDGDGVAVTPPLDVVRDIASLNDCQFPPLIGITEAPVIRPDGSVMNKSGYDNITLLYYYPSPKLRVPPIPDKPTDNDVEAATELALEPVCDFPFDCEASRANAVATMFTPILRPMIDSPVPLTLFDKPQRGTGASLLAEVIGVIATGRAAAMMAARKDDEEWRKAITSLLLRGQRVAIIDNIEGTLYAPSLAAVLTAVTFQDRVLGRSELVTMPNRTTWIGTGNNIKLTGDLPRRCIWVRMDAKLARPWLRDASSFKHPRLIQWVSENRGAILAAILTIARAWVVAGMPAAQGLPNLGGYESYCQIVSGVLAYMGVEGFLGNLNDMYNETDTETPQWEGFLETWHDVLGDKALTAAELIGYINSDTELSAALPDIISDTEAKNYSVRLGQRLAKKNGVRYPNGFALVKAGEKKRAVTWQVIKFENQTSPGISFRGGVGEVCNTPAHSENDGDKGNHNREEGYVTSPNLTLASKTGEVATKPKCPDEDIPEYPTHPCYACGCRKYWLTGWDEWLCSRCHPRSARGEEQ